MSRRGIAKRRSKPDTTASCSPAARRGVKLWTEPCLKYLLRLDELGEELVEVVVGLASALGHAGLQHHVAKLGRIEPDDGA